MTNAFSWTCPTCGRPTTITDPNYHARITDMACSATPEHMGIEVHSTLIECPNTACGAQSLQVRVNRASKQASSAHLRGRPNEPVGVGSFTFLPTTAQPLSSYVPAEVLEDYNEAYLISELSPKASATLARRALQGMIRDFFQLTGHRTLAGELKAIEAKCDPGLYQAMMAVKSVGNIGAHPEQDVNLVVTVEPEEPEALLQLIHLLDQEWYVARADRMQRIANMTQLAATKKPTLPGGT